MKTIILTGAAGFIGLTVAKLFVDLGYEVIAIDDLSSPNADMKPLESMSKNGVRPKLFVRDVGSVAAVEMIVKQFKPFAIVHLAALCDVRESAERRGDYLSANVNATANLIEAAERGGCGRLIFASSCSVYAENENGYVSEDSPLQPASFYGRTKLQAEQIIEAAVDSGAIERAIVLRLFNVAGGWLSRCNQPIRLIDRLIASAAGVAYKPSYRVPIFGDGSAVRDYVDAIDVAWSIKYAADAFIEQGFRFDTFNVGSGVGYSVREVIDAVREVAGEPAVDYVGANEVESSRVTARINKAATVLGWRPSIAFNEIVSNQFSSWGENERNSE
jgi:UDP-glucose 4-epimerase